MHYGKNISILGVLGFWGFGVLGHSGKTEPDMYDPTKKMPVMIAKNALPEKYNLFDKPVLNATIVAGKNPPVDFQLDSKSK